MQVPCVDEFAELDGFRIHYRSFGAGRRAIVFLSGWGCGVGLWRYQAPVLAEKMRVLLVDLPGHGLSDKPAIRYDMALFVRAVSAALDRAGVSTAAVVGHSMGGMVAYEFARRFPNRVSALIWVEGACGAPIQVEEQMAGFRRHAEKFRRPDYREKVLAFISALYVPETPQTVRDEVNEAILSTPQHVLAGCQEGLADPGLFAPETLDIPVFAVWSAFWNPERYADVFQRVLPRLEYEILRGVGHYPMLEKPQEVNAALLRIMQRVPE
jgi:pimeloyl-ACP methyl ester carboxylesterase